MDSTTLIVIAAIAFAMLVFNAIFIGIIFFTQRKAKQSQDWPTTTGTIKVSRIETRYDSDSGSVDYPVVEYSYSVMGKEFTGEKVTPGLQWGGTGARKVVERYPAGSQVKVYYNQENPSEALLETKAPGWVIWLWVGLIGLDLILCCVAVSVGWGMGFGG